MRLPHPVFTHPRRMQRGGTIVAALIFLAIIGTIVTAMLQFAVSNQRLTRRRIEREYVYYAAEAGVDQVIHYFNFPEDHSDDPGLFAEDASTESYWTSPSGQPPYSVNVFSQRIPGGLTLIDETTNEDLIVFTNEPVNTGERARITALDLSLPGAGDPAGAILVVNSTAENPNGVSRTVRAVLSAERPLNLQVDAAIISHVEVGSGGQLNVHWGDGWSRGDLTLPNGGVNNVPTVNSDPWAHLCAVGNVLMPNGKYANGGNGSNTPLYGGSPTAPPATSYNPGTPPNGAANNYYQPWITSDPSHANILQHMDPGMITWPELDYNQWKQIALHRGTYFSTDASGNLYYGTEETAANRISATDFYAIIDQTSDLSVDPNTPGRQTLPEPQVIFIDTVDGNPPNNAANPAASTNLCNVQLSGGGGIYTRGIFYIGGNFRVSGWNAAPASWIQDPGMLDNDPSTTGSQILANVRHTGVIYTVGQYQQQGGQLTYGSIIARGGFGSGGTPDVYYDYRLKDGLAFPFDSEVAVARWEEIPIEAVQ